jgi:hypothetical protein
MGSLRLIGEQEGGSDDHAALCNLDFLSAGHTGFVASDGIAGGQTIKGGIGAGEHLILQSTDHAARGYVRAQDDLQLLSDILRASDGTQRLTLAASAPHLTLTGDTRVSSRLGVGIDPAADYTVRVDEDFSATPTGAAYGVGIRVDSAETAQFGTVIGLYGFAYWSGSSLFGSCRGLDFQAQVNANSSSAATSLVAVKVRASAQPGSYALSAAWGIQLLPGLYQPPTTAYGIDIPDFGVAGGATVYGLRIADQTGPTNSYVIEAGPATPYLRLLGGANPGAYHTNLYLNEGGSLRHVQVKDGASIGAGDRVMVLV